MKFIAKGNGVETNFSELKDPVAFLDNVLKNEPLIKKHDINKKNLQDI